MSNTRPKFSAADAEQICESLEKMREMLIVGLASYGEIERLSDAQKSHKICGGEIPDPLRVIDPTGDAETVSGCATALAYVDIEMRQIRGLAEQEPPDPC